MRALNTIVGLTLTVAAAWWLAGLLSPDALSMLIGILFGALASIPAALLVIAASRRSEAHRPARKPAERPSLGTWQPEAQPPVIVVRGHLVDDVPRLVERKRLEAKGWGEEDWLEGAE